MEHKEIKGADKVTTSKRRALFHLSDSSTISVEKAKPVPPRGDIFVLYCSHCFQDTLGARDFSYAVSGFGQALISDPREKPLDRSAISLMAPNQSQARLNQFSPDFGRESWLAPNGHLRDC